jgi:cell division protein FtsZ
MIKRPKKTTKKSPLNTTKSDLKVEDLGIKKTRIRVIGIGGGGGNIVAEIASRVKKATFVVANTDSQALRGIRKKAIPFQFGENITHGLGTGMNPQLAELAAEAAKDKIKKLLEGQDLVILVATLGGGTGAGAAPVFAKISQSLGNLTYGIFTLPFEFEGEKKMEIARVAFEKFKSKLNVFSILPNERVFQIIEKTTPLKQALSAINKNLADSLEGLIETIYEPGLINIDFADLRTILAGRGRLAYLNTVQAQKSGNSVGDVIERVLGSPLYPYGIRGAKGVLFNISGEKNLGLAEVSQISKTISDLVNREAKIIFGISQNQKYSNTIKTTLFATGCGLRTTFSPGKPKRKKLKRKKQPLAEVSPKIEEKKEEKSSRPPIVKKKKRKINLKSKTKTAKKIKKVKEKMTVEEPPLNKKNESPQEIRIRKNALQIKKEVEEEEKEMLAQEKVWETPSFSRKKGLF